MGQVFTAAPVTAGTWPDLEELFERRGTSVTRGCWCMYYRLTGTVSVSVAAGPEHRQSLQGLVEDGRVPGLLGYVHGVPAAWISLGPRADYAKLARSRIMKPVDDAEVWSVVCTFVARQFRGQGWLHPLLDAAIDWARDQGAPMLEAYPVDKAHRSPDEFMFFGSRSLFEQAGFREVLRRSPTRVVMRRELG